MELYIFSILCIVCLIRQKYTGPCISLKCLYCILHLSRKLILNELRSIYSVYCVQVYIGGVSDFLTMGCL